MTTKIYRPAIENGPIQWSWLTLLGPDAQDFLHRVTTVDVKNLKLGESSPGCFLNAQGKIRSYFKLWHYTPSEYAFEYDAGADGLWKQNLLQAIDQYTFSEKMTLADVTELDCLWVFSEKPTEDLKNLPLRAGQTIVTDSGIRLCHQGVKDYSLTWITAWGKPTTLRNWEASLKNTQEMSLSEIESLRIRALRPRINTEITENTLPLEIGLTDAIAPNKGCYPGQEVIERILALGSPARRLVRIEGLGSLIATGGAPLFNLATPPQEVGQITSIVNNPNGFEALGLVKKIHAKEGYEVQFTVSGDTRVGTITQIAPFSDLVSQT